jgi:hypothetical protein
MILSQEQIPKSIRKLNTTTKNEEPCKGCNGQIHKGLDVHWIDVDNYESLFKKDKDESK